MRKAGVLRGLLVALAIAPLAVGCGKGSNKNIKIEGVDGPRVNFVDNKLTLAVTLVGLQIDYGIRVPVPKMPNSYLEIGPDFQSNGYLINIGMDVRDVIALAGDAVNQLDPAALPGGRPLPGVAAGELPAFAIQVPKLHDITFYIGDKLLGLFVPVNLPWQNYIGSFRFYDGAGDAVGNISIVGKDSSNANSGFLLLINLRGKVGRLIGVPQV